MIKEASDLGAAWSGRMRNKTKNGETYEVETSLSPVLDGSGLLVNHILVSRDLTRENELEKQLWQAQKMEALGDPGRGRGA